MSNGFLDDLDAYDDAYDDAELFDDAEAFDDGESRKSQARRRAQQARLAARRGAQLRAAARRPSTLPAPTSPRAVVSAVKQIDLQTKVQQDDLRAVVAAGNRKLDRANLATVATLLIGEAFRTFGTPDNTFVRAGIQASPLLLLSPGQRRPGVEGVVRHPAFIGGVGALGLAFLGDQRGRGSAVRTVSIVGPGQLVVGSKVLFVADVTDASGRPSSATVTWTSSDPAVATVDTTGVVEAKAAGFAVITASADGVVHRTGLQVAASTGTGTK
ncbi:MAG: Ig-like domain-containing protein [Kineosporiaceae bacterium]|nr:Ig-like domain-containing protein [Kineosporiaceae bacterium]